MDRRSFLRLSAASGLALALPTLEGEARADTPYAGPFWVFVDAVGGWDPIFLTDPKLDASVNRLYTQTATAGAITYAPLPFDATTLKLDPSHADEYLAQWLVSNDAFFQKYHAQLTVLNGVDTSTNNHDVGTRVVWSGRGTEGYPALAALVAAARASDKPLGFLSSGGYDATQGIVPLTRLDSASALQKLAYPGVMDPTNAKSDRYHSADTLARIQQTQTDRLAAMSGAATLPRLRTAMSSLTLARGANAGLDRLQMPALVSIPGYQLGDLQSTMRQVQLTLAAFQAGLAASATINLGGFDTHANHDATQSLQLSKLLATIDYLWTQATALGLASKMVVVVGSDFGRGPGYNGSGGGSGKDHWPTTSMLVMGAGVQGDRVIGASDASSIAQNIDPVTLAPSAAGVKLTPELVHLALRKLAGIDGAQVAKAFPFASSPVPLFG